MDSFPDIRITNAFFANGTLTAALSDGRIIFFPGADMTWLANATPAQQQNFSIETDDYGVWWRELDDGIALHHIFSPASIAAKTKHSAQGVSAS